MAYDDGADWVVQGNLLLESLLISRQITGLCWPMFFDDVFPAVWGQTTPTLVDHTPSRQPFTPSCT